MSTETEIKSMVPNYYSFIMKILNEIWDAEDINNYPLAMERACRLIKYLPEKGKRELTEERERIEKRLKKEVHVTSFFANINNKQAQRQIAKIAKEEEPEFINKITTWLDKVHLLTQSYGVPTRTGSLQKIGDALR